MCQVSATDLPGHWPCPRITPQKIIEPVPSTTVGPNPTQSTPEHTQNPEPDLNPGPTVDKTVIMHDDICVATFSPKP